MIAHDRLIVKEFLCILLIGLGLGVEKDRKVVIIRIIYTGTSENYPFGFWTDLLPEHAF